MKITVKETITKTLVGMAAGCVMACNSFLDVKPESAVSTPETLKDLRALLDNENNINQHFPGLLEMGTDDYFLDYSIFSSRRAFDQAVYLREPEPLFLTANMNQQWASSYQAVATANIVLESLERIKDGNTAEKELLRGEAYFIRGYAFFHLAQLYAKPYIPEGDNSSPGIPLRLSSDITIPSTRGSVEETYEQIIADLIASFDRLPEHVDYKTRPSKTAALAALARVYLTMERYDLAFETANDALNRYDKLINFNDLNIDASYPFEAFNDETIYFGYSSSGSLLLSNTRANIPETLYGSYNDNDLRKYTFYFDKGDGLIRYKGYYNGGTAAYFAGLTTDELYLIRAECHARASRKEQAMADLNRLLETRWRAGTYVPFQADSDGDALKRILEERRKELIFRGVRWSDLRRLNRDERFATTLIRVIDDGTSAKTYTLPPNDSRYTYIIPQEVILRTGMQQNPR